MATRSLTATDLPELRALAMLAEDEGFRFVRRFVDDIAAGSVQLDSPTEFFLAVVEHDRLIAFGGVTPDPYIGDRDAGRVRRVYVRSGHRNQGIGEQLIRALEQRARAAGYTHLRLRTDTSAAARFYERLGYIATTDNSATHYRTLTTPNGTA